LNGPDLAITETRVPEITPEEQALLDRIRAAGDPDDSFPTNEELAEAAPRPSRRP
jgi:hypothetical protein